MNNNMIEQRIAAKAFVEHKGKILIIRESDKYEYGTNKGKYDVIGGRVKPGEGIIGSLQREAAEEIGLDISIGDPFYVGEWRPVINGTELQIFGVFFRCFADSDKVKLGDDHDGSAWIDPKDFKQYKIIENLIPAFEKYIQLVGLG